jgi:hypothetical protein
VHTNNSKRKKRKKKKVPDKGYGMRKCKVFEKKYYLTLRKEIEENPRLVFLLKICIK